MKRKKSRIEEVHFIKIWACFSRAGFGERYWGAEAKQYPQKFIEGVTAMKTPAAALRALLKKLGTTK